VKERERQECLDDDEEKRAIISTVYFVHGDSAGGVKLR